MIKNLWDWLEHRTGISSLLRTALYEHIPGGARWRYVWGSTLVFAFSVQAITGLVLWMGYSPSVSTAWESVYYIQHEMTLGWLVRGLHHFMAQAMVVLLALHFLQVVIDGAYRAPREVNFWLGLVLMQIVLGLALTGYLLPWDQKGMWATRVATNLMGVVPVSGEQVQKVVVGANDYGHHTLTRFFGLHAGLLPALLVAFLALHIAVFRRHGIHAKEPLKKPDCTFWPDQVLRDAVACLGVLAVVLFFVLKPLLSGDAELGGGLGAELGAPADVSKNYSAARPEWYFLFLFQFLKLFEGMGERGEFVGAILIPGAVMGYFFLMPLIGKSKAGHRLNVAFLALLMVGVGVLTFLAKKEDNGNLEYQQAVKSAEQEAERAIELARGGIPPEGMAVFLRSDPKTQGPVLFQRHCASCHDHADPEGNGIKPHREEGDSNLLAPNLFAFGSREWLAGLLDPERIVSNDYFGATEHKSGDMVTFVTDTLSGADKEDVKAVIAAVSAEAGLESQKQADKQDAALIARGRELLAGDIGCKDCHRFQGNGEELGPDLTGYGSKDWLSGMISDPTHKRFYGEHNDRMPAFFKDPNQPEKNRLTRQELEILVSWLRGEWYRSGESADAAAE